MSKKRKKGKNRTSSQSRNKNQKNLIWVIISGVGIVALSLIIWLSVRDNKSLNVDTTTDANGSGNPKLQVDREVIDFGDVEMGEMLSAEFQITNVGNTLLRFTEVPYIELKAGC
jgi:hypothetical protein